MDKKRSIDIDNLKDFSRAKRVLSKKIEKEYFNYWIRQYWIKAYSIYYKQQKY